jgi:DNA-binding CsgD family transcriptional regulator
MDVEKIAELIEQIYGTVCAPDGWVTVGSAILATLGAEQGGLTVNAAAGRRSVRVNLLLDPEAQRSYNEYYGALDGVLASVESLPSGTICAAAEVIDPHKGSEFYADWSHRYGLEDGLFANISSASAGGDAAIFCAAVSARTDGFATPERIAAIRMLIPHLRQSMTVQARLDDLTLVRDGLADAIERSGHAVIVVRAGARIVHANTIARHLLDNRYPVRVDRGGILQAVGSTTASAALTAAVRTATTGGRGPGVRSASSMTAVRSGPGVRYLIQVIPLPETTFGGHAAMVTIVDTAHRLTLDTDVLKDALGLTAAEAVICDKLARGNNLNEIAIDLRVSRTTVRTNLQHVFAKTHTNRQAELVGLLMSFGMVRSAPSRLDRPGFCGDPTICLEPLPVVVHSRAKKFPRTLPEEHTRPRNRTGTEGDGPGLA